MDIDEIFTKDELPANLTEDGTYLVDVGAGIINPDNFNTIYAIGDFGGGTLTIYATPDGTDTNKVALTGGVLSSDGLVSVLCKTKGYILVLSGSTNPDIDIWGL